MRIRPGPNGEFVPGPGAGRMSPLRHEFFQEGGWPPGPHPEYHGQMVAYPPHGFRPEFCGPDGVPDPAMMERAGMDPRMSPHPGMPPHLRPPNGFYPRPPFPHDASYPHSPGLMPGHPEHYPGAPAPGQVSPAPGYPSPDQCPTPVSAHESLMSPHHVQTQHNRQFFPGTTGPGGAAPGQQGSCALSSSSGAAPDSPAPGSSSSSGSMLERALTAKQEPGEEGGEHPHHAGHPPPGHPHHPHPNGDWSQIPADFGDVNVQEFIKHDYGMENMEFTGYPGHPHHGPAGEAEAHHGQYPPHPAAQVSVAPPWVR